MADERASGAAAPQTSLPARRRRRRRSRGRNPAHPGHPAARHIYAALDLGTNNCRLLVARPTHNSFRVVDAFSRIVRLGEGLSHSGRLSESAMVRAIGALRVCAAKLARSPDVRARLIATEACRAAENGADFIARVLEDTGLVLEVIDRETEAVLAAHGCASLLASEAEGAILFDIGGGSSELVFLGQCAPSDAGPPGAVIRSWVSLPLGVVTLAERHGGKTVTRPSFAAMVDAVLPYVVEFAASAGVNGMRGFHLLGTSGTVTTLAGLHLGLPRYDRNRVDGLWLRSAEIDSVLEQLMQSSYEDRVRHPCIGHERADLVLAGCAILEAIRRVFPSERLRVADRGLREGMLLELMRADSVWSRRAGA